VAAGRPPQRFPAIRSKTPRRSRIASLDMAPTSVSTAVCLKRIRVGMLWM
jgi:hypothetical protein